MYAIKAVFDGTSFIPVQPVHVKENYEVVITFIEPVKDAVRRRFGFGCMAGEVRMSDDFDEPLEDFKEYMQ